MLILFIKDQNIYHRLRKIRILSRFFSFSPAHLEEVKDPRLFMDMIDKIKLANGSFKTTRQKRFEIIDQFLISILDSNRHYSIHDIAASDGTTSVELQDILHENDIRHDLIISDKYFAIYYLEKNGAKVYFDEENNILFYSVFGILANRKLSSKYFISKILGQLAYQWWIPNLSQGKKEVLLINPRTMERIEREKIKYKAYDIFSQTGSANDGQYDIIRCMNILNPKYFKLEDIAASLQRIISTMKRDGILILGRTDTDNGLNYATIYKVHCNEKLLEVEKKFNGGSELDILLEQRLITVAEH